MLRISLQRFAQHDSVSMPLQKPVHLFGQLPPNAFGGRNLLNSCFPKAIHRAEPPQ